MLNDWGKKKSKFLAGVGFFYDVVSVTTAVLKVMIRRAQWLRLQMLTFQHYMHKYTIRSYNWNYYKIFKIAPTRFGSQGIHHQGALCSTWLKFQ